jgi:hypothetical protein
LGKDSESLGKDSESLGKDSESLGKDSESLGKDSESLEKDSESLEKVVRKGLGVVRKGLGVVRKGQTGRHGERAPATRAPARGEGPVYQPGRKGNVTLQPNKLSKLISFMDFSPKVACL